MVSAPLTSRATGSTICPGCNRRAATACTCTDPALACASCLANRDRNGWPKNWQEALRTPVCPACGKAGVVVGLDSVLLETVPAVRTHACGVGGPGASSDL